MTQVTLIDGLGQLHTRVYPDVASLPAPFIGGFAVVDGGTAGVVYVSLHDIGGTLVWIALSNLYDAILKNPPSGWNVITSSNTGEYGLFVEGDAGVAAESINYVALTAEQESATPLDPVVIVEREHLTPSMPLVRLIPDGTSQIDIINGLGLEVIASYGTLPSASSDYLSTLARLIAGGTGTDTLWICLEVSGAPTWVQISTGGSGPTDAIVQNPSPNTANTITGASGDANQPLTIRGFGETLERYGDSSQDGFLSYQQDQATSNAGYSEFWQRDNDSIQDMLGINSSSWYTAIVNGLGETGVVSHNESPPDGEGGAFYPALGAVQDNTGKITELYMRIANSGSDQVVQIWPAVQPVFRPTLPGTTENSDFWIDVDFTLFALLPFVLPTGYTAVVLESYGLWGVVTSSTPGFYGGDGFNLEIGATASGVDKLISTLPQMRLLFAAFDTAGNPLLLRGGEFVDGFLSFNAVEDTILYLVPNNNLIGSGKDGMQAHVLISGSSAPWTHVDDFTLTQGAIPWTIFPTAADMVAATNFLVATDCPLASQGAYSADFVGAQCHGCNTECSPSCDGVTTFNDNLAILAFYVDLGASLNVTEFELDLSIGANIQGWTWAVYGSNDLTSFGTILNNATGTGPTTVVAAGAPSGAIRYIILTAFVADCITTPLDLHVSKATISGTGARPPEY